MLSNMTLRVEGKQFAEALERVKTDTILDFSAGEHVVLPVAVSPALPISNLKDFLRNLISETRYG